MNPELSSAIVAWISLVLKTATIGLLLSACEGVRVGHNNIANKNLERAFLQLSFDQFVENREAFGAKIYEFIKDRHPTTAADFPKVKINLVHTSNYWDLDHLLQNPNLTFEEVEDFFRKSELEYDLVVKDLLQEVSDRFSKETSAKKTWEVDLVINEISEAKKTSEEALGVVCIAGNAAAGNWAMLMGFLVCPMEVSTDFQVTAFVKTETSKRPQVVVGYGSAFVTTPILMESAMVPQVDRTAASLAAALASAVDGLVSLYEDQKN